MAIGCVFPHPSPSPPGPCLRALYFRLIGGLNPRTPFLSHIVPGQKGFKYGNQSRTPSPPGPWLRAL